MGIFDKLFALNAQKAPEIAKTPVVESENYILDDTIESEYEIELKELKKQEQKDKNSLNRERLKLELEKKRLEIELEKERLQYEIEEIRFKREQLRQEQYETDDDEQPQGASPELMLMSILAKTMQQPQQGPQPSPIYQPTPTQAPQPPTISDADISAYWQTLNPALKQMAKNASDETIRTQLINQMPDITQQDTSRIIQHIRAN